MDFVLAKKLKDAGYTFKLFPYEIKNPGYHEWLLFDGEKYEFPTLSELIEACGKAFYELRRLNPEYHSMPIDGMVWEASSPEVTPMLYVASTPEEAVANLWLALNEKK